MEFVLTVLEVIGIYVVLPITVGLVIIGIARLYDSIMHKVPESSVERPESFVCAVDSDCPAGYICIDGQCIQHGDAENIISAVI